MPTFSFSPRVWWGACLLLCAARLLWPGDVAFAHDESLIFTLALDGGLFDFPLHGLKGSFGVAYGPWPVYVYRWLLAATHSLTAVVWIKTLVVSGAMLASVFTFLRFFPALPRWTSVVPFLSPYLWYYSRDLWDNSFNVATSAGLLVAYLAWLRDGRRRWLTLCAACAVSTVLTHLMGLPLIAAIALHAVFFERRRLLAHPVFLGTLLVFSILPCLPYLNYLLHTPSTAGPFWFRWASVWFALLGGRDFTALAAEYYWGPYWFWVGPMPWLGAVVVGLTGYALVPTLYGMGALGKRLGGRRDLAFDLAFVSAVAMALHLVLMLRYRLVSHPHYYNGIWFVFFAFLCWGQGALEARWRGWRAVGGVYLGASLLAWVAIVGVTHGFSGNRVRYGTTLANQLAASAEIQCYPPETPLYDERVESRYGAIAVFRRLVACPGEPKKARELHLRYVRPHDIRDGQVEVVPVN